MFRTILKRAMALGLVAAMASIGIVAATPGSNAVGQILSVGTLTAGVKIHTDDLKFSTRDDIQIVTQTITIAPGGHTGWHTHPGPAFATIAAGTFTVYDAEDPTCSARTYQTGDTFADLGGSHVHLARNEGNVDLLIYVTYFVPIGASIRTDVPHPGVCPF